MCSVLAPKVMPSRKLQATAIVVVFCIIFSIKGFPLCFPYSNTHSQTQLIEGSHIFLKQGFGSFTGNFPSQACTESAFKQGHAGPIHHSCSFEYKLKEVYLHFHHIKNPTSIPVPSYKHTFLCNLSSLGALYATNHGGRRGKRLKKLLKLCLSLLRVGQAERCVPFFQVYFNPHHRKRRS